MRTNLIGCVGGAAVLLLGGCVAPPDDPGPAPARETVVSTPAPAPAVRTPVIEETTNPPVDVTQFDRETVDMMFLTVVHNATPISQGLEDAVVIDLAESICVALDSGASIEEIFMLAIEESMDTELFGSVAGAGISAYCPQHLDQIP